MIVGLCGLARSGKDTAAAHLVACHRYQRRAFADQLRTALYALNPHVQTGAATLPLQHLVDHKGWDQAKGYPDVRRLLQRMGTEVGRELWGEQFWVQRATANLEPEDRIVFTDVRFPNEAAAIRYLHGIVVKIERPGNGGLEGGTALHASEALAFDVDHTLVNDDTPEILGRRLHELVWRAEVDGLRSITHPA